MPICDGCGAQVDDAHIRRRIERLELATRFRPIHISVLFIDSAPPVRPEDYVYRPAANRAERSPAARAYFDALMEAAGIAPLAASGEEADIAEFQRRGFFLVAALECPPADMAGLQAAVEHTALAMLRRVNVSYKPKTIALLSASTQPLIPVFQQTEWRARLALDEGRPFSVPLSSTRLAECVASAARY